MKLLSFSLFAYFLFSLALSALAQTVPDHRGVQLYRQQKYSEAASVLGGAVKDKQWKSDASLWNYFGLACLEIGDFKRARKAFEKAVSLRPDDSSYHVNLAYIYLLFRQTNKSQAAAKKAIALDPRNASAYYLRGSASLWEMDLDNAKIDADQILAIEPANPQGYLLSANIHLARLSKAVLSDTDADAVREHIHLLKEARDILRTGAEKTNNAKVIRDDLASIDAFYEYFSKDRTRSTPSPPDPSVTPLTLIDKPRPSYTDSARRANRQGVIRMAVLFGASGNIEGVLLLKRLGYGLDEQALAAARKITFEPKKINGKPVAVVRVLEYSFSTY